MIFFNNHVFFNDHVFFFYINYSLVYAVKILLLGELRKLHLSPPSFIHRAQKLCCLASMQGRTQRGATSIDNFGSVQKFFLQTLVEIIFRSQ